MSGARLSEGKKGDRRPVLIAKLTMNPTGRSCLPHCFLPSCRSLPSRFVARAGDTQVCGFQMSVSMPKSMLFAETDETEFQS